MPDPDNDNESDNDSNKPNPDDDNDDGDENKASCIDSTTEYGVKAKTYQSFNS